MKILYKPFALIGSAIAKPVSQSTFRAIWSRIDEEEPPEATTHQTTLGKVLLATALEAAVVALVSAAVDRGTAVTFHYLTGAWPGDEHPDED